MIQKAGDGMKPFGMILLCVLLIFLTGCISKKPTVETEPAPSTEPVGTGAVLRFSSFDGGGPEYTAVADDPSLLTWTAVREYDNPDHDLETGSSYEMVFTFRGLATGTTGLTIFGASPITEPESFLYRADVDADLNVTLTPVRTLSRLTVFRNGSIAYDSYAIAPQEDGYVLTVNEESSKKISRETVDALYAVFEKYELAQWDGFRESRSGVLDGEGFWLEIALTDGTTVFASGDNAFPAHYFDAMGELWDILTEAAAQPE